MAERTKLGELRDFPESWRTGEGWRQFGRDFEVGGRRPEHLHEDSQLLYAASGVMLVMSEGVPRILAPFQALWIPAGVPHSITFLSDTQMRNLYFPVERSRAAGLPDRIRTLAVTPLVRELMAALFSRAFPAETLDLMSTLTLRLVAESPELGTALAMPRDPAMARVLTGILHDRVWERPVGEVAAALHLTPKTFSRHFQRELGMSYRDWLVRARLSVSLDALARGLSVKAAAAGAGYSDAVTYGTAFRRLFGMTPGEVRGRLLGE
ncbi:helix-turn-helix transcriptional regulator [Sutterella sp.]|uniref:AraC family transcriptional regulator n=1 Tax=Sutterella sp. TaxID=1981025 RepID=UPI0026DFDED4|nr:helix-turn-helix transcriptional regulator [Sutterella sp.]MDO5532505.1 helix-turn-helix transcriptional regulator [Sutterella sp.]